MCNIIVKVGLNGKDVVLGCFVRGQRVVFDYGLQQSQGSTFVQDLHLAGWFRWRRDRRDHEGKGRRQGQGRTAGARLKYHFTGQLSFLVTFPFRSRPISFLVFLFYLLRENNIKFEQYFWKLIIMRSYLCV